MNEETVNKKQKIKIVITMDGKVGYFKASN